PRCRSSAPTSWPRNPSWPAGSRSRSGCSAGTSPTSAPTTRSGAGSAASWARSTSTARSPGSREERTMITVQAGAALEPITRGPISRSQIARFAAATGDFNPIHTDEAFAQKIGFPSVIAHGPLTLAFLTQALGHNFGAERVRGVTAQFRAPILPGDTLRVEGTVTEG